MNSHTSMLRRTAAPLLFAALTLLAFGGAAAQDRAGFPAILIDPGAIDFGTLSQEEARTSTVTISNVGGAALVIERVESTCGCTVATPEKSSLEPGESTPLVITFSSKQFQGNQYKSVRIHSNDPAEAIVEIAVKAFVKVPLVFTPGEKMVSFGRLRAGEAEPRIIKLLSTDGIALDIEPVRVNEAKLKVTIRDSKSGLPSEKELLVELADGIAPGAIREILSFKTNVPEQPTFDIEVAALVLADVQVIPEDVNFRYVRRDQALERMFELKMPADMNLKITSATVDLPGFEVEKVVKNNHTGFFNIFVKGSPLPADDPRVINAKGRMIGKLQIAVDDPRFPMFEATIKYLVRI
jgi:uncharacterized protein DUF1573